jgi:hypothetical protein
MQEQALTASAVEASEATRATPCERKRAFHQQNMVWFFNHHKHMVSFSITINKQHLEDRESKTSARRNAITHTPRTPRTPRTRHEPATPLPPSPPQAVSTHSYAASASSSAPSPARASTVREDACGLGVFRPKPTHTSNTERCSSDSVKAARVRCSSSNSAVSLATAGVVSTRSTKGTHE